MKTQVLEQITDVQQEIQLVKGEFTPSEALDVINGLIQEKINFHKIQRLQLWEGDHLCSTDMLNGRIAELFEEKKIAREFINKVRSEGGKLQINGTLEISVIK